MTGEPTRQRRGLAVTFLVLAVVLGLWFTWAVVVNRSASVCEWSGGELQLLRGEQQCVYGEGMP